MGFSLKELDSLKGVKNRADYAQKHLRRLGYGSARIAYDVGDKVLKVARSDAGIEQNKAEVLSGYDKYPLFAKIYEYGDDFGWLTMEKAKPLTEGAFERTIRAKWNEILLLLEYMDNGKGNDKFYDLCVYGQDKDFNKTLGYDFFNSIIEWFEEEEPEREVWEDLDVEENWGWAIRNGRRFPVVIDYGTTKDTMERFYK